MSTSDRLRCSPDFMVFYFIYLRYATRGLSSYLGFREPLSQMPLLQHRAYSSDPPAQSRFTYRLAAAAAGKRTPSRAPKAWQDYWLYTSTQVNATPPYLRSTKPNSGEDAFFAATVGGSKHHVAFGVADGVGGWQDQGVDPSDFSHGLCGLMAGTAYIHDALEAGKNVRPQELMQTAYDAVIVNPRIVAGGCTASLAVVDGAGGMETANLGDSGFLIFSPGRVAHRSQIQTHAFNTPYQLAKVPPKMQAQNAIFGGSAHYSETPAQADVERYQLKHGDVVLFATDGVWDNLSAQDTLGVVTKVMEEHGYWFKSHNFPGAESLLNATLIGSLPQEVDQKSGVKTPYLPGLLATAVMREAKVAGLDTRRNGPFAKEVNLLYPQEGWRGGKADDIAVVVCIAVEDGVAAIEESTAIKAKL
ncbi:Protein phosphatase 2C 7 [Friedmanniomyces endolithicus]|nr:Protein phosphatase 2C 7 [Friedmanniomyces endolithicus]KAK0793532.1 Protein phosphatase 2C 7 [Friedmanniomyces endolithicus]KAK0801512.1 Protein phosphatase 2C 7 [Friedmanniomyces endolithicus]